MRTQERKDYEREWAKQNGDKVRAYRARWADKNQDYWKDRHEKNLAAHRARMKANYEANKPAYLERSRRRRLRVKYGLTVAAYELLLAAAGHQCEVCGSQKKLVVDHNHDTGHVRGILCSACNVGLGRFKDDADRLELALAYLRQRNVENVA